MGNNGVGGVPFSTLFRGRAAVAGLIFVFPRFYYLPKLG
jgi:hypothetical protein